MIAGALLLAALAARDLPQPTLTPGVTRHLSVQTICATKWGKDKRHVTETMKVHVAAAYGIYWPTTLHGHRLTAAERAYRLSGEWDHLISRELGGADDEKNLWFELYEGAWNAHMKDRLENNLHVRVCAGTLSLPAAQRAIATDWRLAFQTYVDAHATDASTHSAGAGER
jgi:hypothetical protein